MTVEQLPVPRYEPLTAENIETARICAGSFHHRHRVVAQLEARKKDLAEQQAIIDMEEDRLPKLRANRSVLEQDIRTLETILAEVDE